MGINAVKGVEIGAGFDSVAQRGSVRRRADGRFRRQPCGRRARRDFDRAGHHRVDRDQADVEHPHAAPFDHEGRRRSDVETFGRHDPCVGIRATPIAERCSRWC
jgi:chorismate synthase